MLRVSGRVDWRFHVALVLAHETGDRIGAIRHLRWSDIDLEDRTILWRAEHEKSGYEHRTPVTAEALAALEEAQRRNPGNEDAPVLPARCSKLRSAAEGVKTTTRGLTPAGIRPTIPGSPPSGTGGRSHLIGADEMKPAKWILGLLVVILLPASPAEAQGRRNLTPEQQAERQRRMEEMRVAARPIEGINSIWIDELTWMEVRDEIASGKTIGIIATGGVEQNGPYMAGGKHNYVLEAMCDAIARELGNALCAPVMKYVPEGDPENIRYPGTLSVRQETFRMVLEDVANSLKSQGFTDVVFIGDSGGNQNGMSDTAEKLNEYWGGTARAHYIEEYYREDIWSCVFLEEELGIFQKPDICSATRDIYHDDVHYSSIVATTDPDRIRARQRMEEGLYSINEVELGPVERTIEIGERLIEYRTGITVRAIRESMGR